MKTLHTYLEEARQDSKKLKAREVENLVKLHKRPPDLDDTALFIPNYNRSSEKATIKGLENKGAVKVTMVGKHAVVEFDPSLLKKGVKHSEPKYKDSYYEPGRSKYRSTPYG